MKKIEDLVFQLTGKLARRVTELEKRLAELEHSQTMFLQSRNLSSEPKPDECEEKEWTCDFCGCHTSWFDRTWEEDEDGEGGGMSYRCDGCGRKTTEKKDPPHDELAERLYEIHKKTPHHELQQSCREFDAFWTVVASEARKWMREKYNEQTFIEALSRGFCSKENQHKEMDATLVKAMVEELKRIGEKGL